MNTRSGGFSYLLFSHLLFSHLSFSYLIGNPFPSSLTDGGIYEVRGTNLIYLSFDLHFPDRQCCLL